MKTKRRKCKKKKKQLPPPPCFKGYQPNLFSSTFSHSPLPCTCATVLKSQLSCSFKHVTEHKNLFIDMFNLDAMIALTITNYHFISSNIIIYIPLVIANTIIQCTNAVQTLWLNNMFFIC